MTKELAKFLLAAMLRESYPEIRLRSVKVKFVEKRDYYMASQWQIFRTLLFIDKSILKYSETAFKGCLAHELAHVLENNNLLFKILTFRAKSLSEVEAERKADTIAVQRGFGTHLLQFHEEHNKKHKKYKASEGLTPKEIKVLLRESL